MTVEVLLDVAGLVYATWRHCWHLDVVIVSVLVVVIAVVLVVVIAVVVAVVIAVVLVVPTEVVVVTVFDQFLHFD